MKLRFCAVVLVFMSICLTSCTLPSLHDLNISPSGISDVISDNNDVTDNLGLKRITSQQGLIMTAGGETMQGCYQLDEYADGSADVIYFDYATQNCVRLSNDPNVAHSEGSTAYISSTAGGANCLVSEDVLYVLKIGLPYAANIASHDSIARLYCMNLDGSGRVEKEYGSNIVYSPGCCMVGDNSGNLYMMLNIIDTEDPSASTVCLAAMGKDIDGYNVIRSWPGSMRVDLVGASGNSFLIETRTVQEEKTIKTLERIDVNGESLGKVLSWPNFDVTYTAEASVLYYTQQADTQVYRIDLDTGETLSAILPDIGENTSVSVQYEVRDNHLILATQSGMIAYNLTTGETSPMTLYYGEGDDRTFVGIFAEGEHDFLVRLGSFTRTRTDTAPDGSLYTFEQGFQDYVLISKEDYWANNPEYRRFTYYE